MILIIGNKGNMGRRYKACLDYLNIENDGFDWENITRDKKELLFAAERIILATPTDTHYQLLKSLYNTGIRVPVLCEKPISKDLEEVREIEKISKEMPISMVFQYAFTDLIGYKTSILDKKTKYQSYYNYFKHGNDGMAFDCIQIINMAENKPLLLNTSPVWDCLINGYRIEAESMDRSYLRMLENWIEHPGWNYKGLVEMHEKVVNFA